MATRTITGPVNDVTGVGIPAGTVVITPLVPAGTTANGFVVQASEFPIVNGAFSAELVVPGSYKLEVNDADGERLRSFNANISGESLAAISLKELWESRLDPLEIPAGVMHEGASLLRLVPGGGTAGQVLTQREGGLLWTRPPRDGDMDSDVYDPTGRHADAFVRGNHTGTQAMGTVQGLEAALDGAWLRGFSEYAIICDRKPNGTPGGSTTMRVYLPRTLNTVLLNNSGLSNAALLNTTDSSITLLPGRVYFGWAEAPAVRSDVHHLRLKSTDNAIVVNGRGQVSESDGSTTGHSYTRIEFHFSIAAGGSNKVVQLLHRLWSVSAGTSALGLPLQAQALDADTDEEYARITIFSRPL